jgi:predicted ATPase
VHQLRDDWRTTREYAEAACALAGEGGFVQLRAWADVMRGWALVQAGRGEPGIATMRDGITALGDLGSREFMTYFLGLLAEGLVGAGQPGPALDIIADALALAGRCGERFYEAELLRLRGTAWRAEGAAPARATESFETALATARAQHAQALERRVLADLGRD